MPTPPPLHPSRPPFSPLFFARLSLGAVVTTLETFDVYRVSLDACRTCSPIAPALSANLRERKAQPLSTW